MRTLYLIFAHSQPEQLVRLTNTIGELSPDAVIAIHYDPSNGPLSPDIFSKTKVNLIPHPIHGEWGDYSLVEQYLHSIEWCLQHLEWDWLCTLTGLSYPISSLQAFEEKLYGSNFDAFVRYFDALAAPERVWPKNTGAQRYLYKYYIIPRFPYYYRVPQNIRKLLSRVREILNAAQPLIKLCPMPRGARTRIGIRRLRLPLPPSFRLYAGRQMLNINRKAAENIFAFLSHNRQYEKYFKRTIIPDESFFVTLIVNDPDLRVHNNVLRYIKWPSGRVDAASVAVIKKEDLEAAMQSGAPFGLKFDGQQKPGLLDYVDELLGINLVRRVHLKKD